MSYSTGWIYKADLKSQVIPVVHSLDMNFVDLLVFVFWSDQADGSNPQACKLGWGGRGIDPDELEIITDTSGLAYQEGTGVYLATEGYYNVKVVESTGGAAETYTGTAERNVGSITDGQVFTAQTMTQMWDSLIKQEKFPALTPPSRTFTSTVTGYREVGEVIASIVFDSAFNKGSINPQYTATTPFRSGDPNTYEFTGTGLSNQAKTALTDQQTVLGYTVVIGDQNWQGRVAYDIGPQPMSSYNNAYDSPYPAGTTSYITRTITGVYPVFATTVAIATLTSQTLSSMSASYKQTDVVAESGGDKQTTDFPTGYSAITGIQFYNTVSTAYEWINGSKANSLLTFTQSATTHTIQGNVINYTRYTHNGPSIGARQLRWYTT